MRKADRDGRVCWRTGVIDHEKTVSALVAEDVFARSAEAVLDRGHGKLLNDVSRQIADRLHEPRLVSV